MSLIKNTGNVDLRNSLVDLYADREETPIRYTLSQFLDIYEEEITVYDALGLSRTCSPRELASGGGRVSRDVEVRHQGVESPRLG